MFKRIGTLVLFAAIGSSYVNADTKLKEVPREIPKLAVEKDDLSGWYFDFDPKTDALLGTVSVTRINTKTYFVVWIYNVTIDEMGTISQKTTSGIGKVRNNVIAIQMLPSKDLYLYEIIKSPNGFRVSGDEDVRYSIKSPKLSSTEIESFISVESDEPDSKSDKSVICAILRDGSRIKVSTEITDLEIRTRYGKLAVPINEIRRIEFGVHYPDGVKSRIEKAISLLGSPIYKERENAERELLYFGSLSYPLVAKSRMGKGVLLELEKQKRSNKILGMLKTAYPESVKVSLEDTISTNDSVLKGEVVTDGWKVNSPLLGDFSLRLFAIKEVHVLSSLRDSEFELDAAVHNGSVWLTAKRINGFGEKLSIACEGKIDLWPQGNGQYVTTPKGYTSNGVKFAFPAGSIIGKIGENGTPFLIGERLDNINTKEMDLYLTIVPSPWNNASEGTYKVKLKTTFD